MTTLENIRAFGDVSSTPQGTVVGLSLGKNDEDAEDLVKVSTENAGELKNRDLVKISGTRGYQGHYRATKLDEDRFTIDIPLKDGLGYWEKQEEESGGLSFDGMITAYEKTVDGKLCVICPGHGLNYDDEVQVSGTEAYNGIYPVRKIDDTHFVIEQKWAMGEAINISRLSRERRGIVFDGMADYVEIPDSPSLQFGTSTDLTIELWVKSSAAPKSDAYPHLLSNWNINSPVESGGGCSFYQHDKFTEFALVDKNGNDSSLKFAVINDGVWRHLAVSVDRDGDMLGYLDGVEVSRTDASGIKEFDSGLGLKIAQDGTGNSSYWFEGQIADLRIWKVVRTAADIRNSMHLQLTGKETGLVGYWRLGAIAEGRVVDFSVNGNDGIVHGDPYVSAETLDRTLQSGLPVVLYCNDDLFAVSEGATYKESFEFKLNSTMEATLDYLTNADGRGNPIFRPSYWGKANRSAEDKKSISSPDRYKFEDIGDGWFLASCEVTIPENIGMIRTFEISNIQGDWISLEIRKHRVRLVSDSISESRTIDAVNLKPLADNHIELQKTLKELAHKESEEAILLKKKSMLEKDIAFLEDLSGLKKKVNDLKTDVENLAETQGKHQASYNEEIANPRNYWFRLQVRHNGSYLDDLGGGGRGIGLWKLDKGSQQQWRLVAAGGEYYRIQVRHSNLYLDDLGGGGQGIGLGNWDKGSQQQWKLVPADGEYYRIQARHNSLYLYDLGGGGHGIGLFTWNAGRQQQWRLVRTDDQVNNNIAPILFTDVTHRR